MNDIEIKIYKIILKEYLNHSLIKNKVTWHKRLENLGIKIFQNSFEDPENYFDFKTEALGKIQVPKCLAQKMLIFKGFP